MHLSICFQYFTFVAEVHLLLKIKKKLYPRLLWTSNHVEYVHLFQCFGTMILQYIKDISHKITLMEWFLILTASGIFICSIRDILFLDDSDWSGASADINSSLWFLAHSHYFKFLLLIILKGKTKLNKTASYCLYEKQNSQFQI